MLPGWGKWVVLLWSRGKIGAFHDTQQGRVQWWRPMHSEIEWVASRSECPAHTSQDARKLPLKKQWTSNLSVFCLVPWCTQITFKKKSSVFTNKHGWESGATPLSRWLHMVFPHKYFPYITSHIPYKINAMCIEHTTVWWVNGMHKYKGVLCYSSVKYTHACLARRWILFQ